MIKDCDNLSKDLFDVTCIILESIYHKTTKLIYMTVVAYPLIIMGMSPVI